MGEQDWNHKIDYLSRTRGLYYNDDYLEFLVKRVWGMDKPVHLIDFGCGYGYLGLKLLPLLPEGTKYTGVDAAETLIRRAEELYKNLPYEAEFITADIQTITLERNYDMAVCHAFLLHVPNPKTILRKMMDCVVERGRVVCFEPNWTANMANYYLDGIDQSEVIQLGVLQKLYESDARRGGKDGNIGLKLPVYFSQLGLTDVQCRMSDKVNFLDPNADSSRMSRLFESLREECTHPGELDAYVHRLKSRGLTCEEAEQLHKNELFFADTLDQSTFFTCAPNMKITFGTVAGPA